MFVKSIYAELSQKIADLEQWNEELRQLKVALQPSDEETGLVDLEGKLLGAYATFCSILEASREELLQRNGCDFKPTQIVPLEGESILKVVTRDIAWRREQEEALRRYEKVFSVTKDIVAFVDANYIYQMVNESYTRDHNKKSEEIVGRSVAEMLGQDLFQETVKPHIDRCLSGETVRYKAWFEYTAVGRRYRDVTYYPHRLEDKRVAGVFVVARDMTYLKLAQEAQQAKHNLLSHILDNTLNGVFVVNSTHDILYSNPALERDFGSVVNRKCYEALSERKTPCPWCKSKQVYSGESVQWEWKSPKIHKSYVCSQSVLPNTEYGLAKVVFLMDITQQRRVENDLRDHNELLLTLINASPDIICLKDGEGRWLLANETDLKLFQLTGVDYQGKTDADLSQYTEFYQQALMTCMDSDEEAWSKRQPSVGEEVIPTPDGGQKIFEVVKVPLFHADGSRKGLVVLGHDITDRIDKEERLRWEIDARRQASHILEQKNKEVEEANIALRVLVNQQQNAVKETQQNVLIHLDNAVFPYITFLRKNLKSGYEREYLDILTNHLRSVGTSFIKQLGDPNLGLTGKELLVADLVKQGKNTKEIAQLLGLQKTTVEAYRNKIRKKLHITNKKISLKQYLSSNFLFEG